MKTTVPTLYYEGKDKKKRILWKKRYIPDYYNTYQFFYFGRDAQTITNAQDFSIYRGTYRNLDKFVKYSSIINDANNPAKSSKDKTDLTKK
ncbi:hypothetical protein IJU97_01120 [bacterium]|nr:hypothetical protein [bacterium]